MNELCHLLEVIFHQASRGQRWRTKPQTTGAQSTLIPYKHMDVEILRTAFCREKRTFTRISHKDKGLHSYAKKSCIYNCLSAVELPGQVFLLQAMAQASRTFSARPPSVPLLRRSSRIRWLSEPPTQGEKKGYQTPQRL